MEGPGDQLLSGPGLAGDHHRDVAARHAVDRGQDLAQRVGVADQAVRPLPALQVIDLQQQPTLGERAADGGHQAGLVDRLGQEVVGAGLDRLGRDLGRAVRRREDHRGRQPLAERPEQLQPVLLAELPVEDHDVGVGQVVDHGLAQEDLMLVRLEQDPQQRAEVRVVVDHQDLGHGLPPRRPESQFACRASRHGTQST